MVIDGGVARSIASATRGLPRFTITGTNTPITAIVIKLARRRASRHQ